MTDQPFWSTLGSILEASARGQPHLQAAECSSCIKTGLLDPTGDQVKGKDLGMVHASPDC